MDNKKVSETTQSIVDKVFHTLELDTENFGWAMESIVDHVSSEVSSLIDEMELKKKEDMARAAAAMDNFKKRKEREFKSLKKIVNKETIMAILPVLDSIDISIRLKGDLENSNVLQEQFLSILKSLGVERIKVGSEFDPNYHEAVAIQEGDSELKVMLNGYTLNNVLIRPAKVIVYRKDCND